MTSTRQCGLQVFQQMLLGSPDERDEDEVEQNKTADGVLSTQRVRDWLVATTNDSPVDSDIGLPTDTDDDWSGPVEEHLDDFETYTHLVVSHASFQWLLSKFRNRLRTTEATCENTARIRNDVMSAFPGLNSVRGSTQCSTFCARFLVSWDLEGFLREQTISGSTVASVARIITLSGTVDNARALTCEEYMDQTWPTTGLHLVTLIDESLRPQRSASCRRPDGTKMTAEWGHSQLALTVEGTKGVIAEVAEQVSWLGAALRTSPWAKELACCSPSIHLVRRNEYDFSTSSIAQPYDSGRLHQRQDVNEYAGKPMHEFKVGFEHSDIPSLTVGACWQPLLQNSVIVKGFPIRQRPWPGIGLEIPLNMVACLVNTAFTSAFYDNIYLKGFSAMLVAMRQVEDIVIWHLHHDETGARVAYLEGDDALLSTTTIGDLGCLRHIVGWCTHASHRDVASTRSWKVKRSTCEKAKTGSALGNCSVSFNGPIHGGSSFVVLKKDLTIHVSRNPYHKKLAYLADNFLLFWDTRDERGWVIKAVSALLQLVLASLRIHQTGPFHSTFDLEWSELQEAAAPYTATASAALEVLKNMANLSLTLTKHEPCSEQGPDAEPEIFAHRVEEFYHALERILTYQEHIEHKDELRRSRGQLEGWDFDDLASQRHPTRPCRTMLPTMGKSWVDFLRSISCVTIFGHNFGELLLPGETSCCPAWSLLPSGKFYIAISLTDLDTITRIHGIPESIPRKLSDATVWHSPCLPFGTAACHTSDQLHTNIVQVLWPAYLVKSLPATIHSTELDVVTSANLNGAVVFGYNDTFQWHWKDHGDPVAGPPHNAAQMSEASFHDTGQGTSLQSSLEEVTAGADLPSAPPYAPIHRPENERQGAGHTFAGSSNYGGTNQFGDHYGHSYAINNYLSFPPAFASMTRPVESQWLNPSYMQPTTTTARRQQITPTSDQTPGRLLAVSNAAHLVLPGIERRPPKRQRLQSTNSTGRDSGFSSMQLANDLPTRVSTAEHNAREPKKCCRRHTLILECKGREDCHYCVHEYCDSCGSQPPLSRLLHVDKRCKES